MLDYIRLGRLARDKHCGLFGPFISYEHRHLRIYRLLNGTYCIIEKKKLTIGRPAEYLHFITKNQAKGKNDMP